MSTNRVAVQPKHGRLVVRSRRAEPGAGHSAKWYLYLGAFLLTVLGMVVVAAPVNPGESSYLADAAQLRGGLRYDLALDRYADASRVAPQDAKPHCLEGQILNLQHEWQEAVKAYARCAALDPASGVIWLALGNARNQVGDSADALKDWQKSFDLGDMSGGEQLALAAETRGDVAGAIEWWRRQPQSSPTALAHLGILSLWQGDWASAGQYMAKAERSHVLWLVTDRFTAVATLQPNQFLRESQLGQAFLSANLPALALAPWQRAVKLAPSSGETRAYLGWTLLLLGQPRLAAPDISLGLERDSTNSFVWFAAGELAMSERQPSVGLQYFQMGVRLDPNNPVLWAQAGQAALELRDYTAAEQMLQTASNLSSSPTSAIALLDLYVDYRLGLSDGSALHAATLALTRWKGNEPLEFRLAEIYAASNETTNAYYAAKAAEQLDPTDPGPYVLLGLQAENEGNYVTAAVLLRTALALRPDGPLAAEAETLLAPIADITV